MEGIKLEVEATVTYTVTLTEEDMKIIKEYINASSDKQMLSIFSKNELLDAINELVSDCKIGLYEDDKAVESDFYTSDIQLSHYEERDPEEILMELGFDVGIE